MALITIYWACSHTQRRLICKALDIPLWMTVQGETPVDASAELMERLRAAEIERHIQIRRGKPDLMRAFEITKPK